MKKLSIVTTLLLFSGFLYAQKITPEQYINTYKNLAIAEMKRTGIPASITLAQGLLETESGNSDLVQKSNNHFGIKCKSTWTGESVTHTDDAPNECFRKYGKPEDSYRDHSDYLSTSARYASLFKLDAADYRGWCYGLKKCGYATNPRYPQILMSNIEKYNLQQFDSGDTSAEEEIFADAKIINQNNEIKTIAIAPVAIDEKAIDNSLKGKTSFNKLKALFANKGTSLLAIATKADLPLAKLLEYNDLKTDGLLPEDQWIYLERKLKEGNRDYYIALERESLYDISQNNGVQLQALAQLNNMTETETVSKGKKIRLRASAVADNNPQPKEKVHTVLPKEGLYAISKKYNVPVQQIKEINALSDDSLRPGQQLIISK